MSSLLVAKKGATLRTKLLIAFFVLAIIAGATSGVSVVFMSGIKEKIKRVSETAFPLACMTKSLVEDMSNAHVNILELLNTRNPLKIQKQAAVFQELEDKLKIKLNRLNDMVEKDDIELGTGSLSQAQEEFFLQARNVIAAYQATLEKQSGKNRRLEEFDQIRREADDRLKSFNNMAETAINEKEDVARTMEQSGEASVDGMVGFISDMFNYDFPLLKGASTLQNYLIELNNVSVSYLNERSNEKLEAIEKEFRKLIKKSNKRIKRTQRSLETPEQKNSLKKVKESLAYLENSVLAENGLFVTHREYLRARLEIERLLELLTSAIDNYKSAIVDISSSSEEITTQAQKSMEDMVGIAQKSIVAIILVCITIAILFGVVFSGSITKPINRIVEFTHVIRQGGLSKRLNMDRSDEVGQLAKAIDAMAETLDRNDAQIKENMSVMEDILSQGTIVAQQVSSGSNQLLETSQMVSQGASEQAASLQEITSAMNLIGSQTKTNAENASLADNMAKRVRDAAEIGNTRMESMKTAMDDINESSREIAKIMKAIDDIAFQTNLLALNAAVEAARAGAHGKGFAVVAQEVRNLATRSANAAHMTAELIDNSVSKAKDGADIVNNTAEALKEIVGGIGKVTDLVGEIAASSGEQSRGIKSANQGLGMIEHVTQQNTATAEETASASVELSSLSKKLKEILYRHNRLDGAESSNEMLPEPIVPGSIGIQPYAPEWGSKGAEWGLEYRTAGPEGTIILDEKDFGKY